MTGSRCWGLAGADPGRRPGGRPSAPPRSRRGVQACTWCGAGKGQDLRPGRRWPGGGGGGRRVGCLLRRCDGRCASSPRSRRGWPGCAFVGAVAA
ncbi:hypothetical protein QJS66_14180 [Kocuria rhizophila]|nr:hypothetical protein QJS66_14180 [Kocuria rhizophila]